LTFDAQTYEVTWNIDQQNPNYVPSLAKTLVQLHNISTTEASSKQIKTQQPDDLRLEISSRLHQVKCELGISEALESRYLKWLDSDSLWPNFTKFIHGDLYAGHILTTPEGVVTGIIDWTTGHVGDPALDFSGHFNVFGAESLKLLISAYEKEGGQVWDKMHEQVLERAAATALAYGFFALETQDEKHIAGAKTMLGIV
jgi:macrolide phosphotransferase